MRRRRAPSGPVTTTMSPGRAPARPGTRSERPSAVTLTDTCVGPGRVAADARARPPRRCPRRARPRRSTATSPGSASVTKSASGRAAEAERSLMLTAAARKPSSRHEIQSSRKWTPSTSASWVTTSPSASSAASCSVPTISPRDSSSRSSPSSPASESRIDSLPQRLDLRDGADDGDAGRTGANAVGRVGGVDAADRDHGHRHREADVAEPVEADRRACVGLRRRLPDRSRAEVGRSRELRDRGLAPLGDGDPERDARPRAPARCRGRSGRDGRRSRARARPRGRR